tara:strand:- start:2451 stop:3749 length:1299 start_codon:yes stop_codon:yes gene_type:complete
MKTYVLDTNVYLTEPKAIYAYEDSDIAIPTIVLDEIDKHKHRQDTVGFNARQVNRILDSLRAGGNYVDGIPLGEGKGKIYVAHYDDRHMPVGLYQDESDNKILAAAISLREKGKDVIVVSRDLNMRIKCDGFGLETHDYEIDKVVRSVDHLFTGVKEVTVTQEQIDEFYQKGKLTLKEEDNLYPNEFVILNAGSDDKQSALCKNIAKGKLVSVTKHADIWGMLPRNKEQTFALDLLFDSSIELVSLIGPAGTGKTLLAAAAGLEQVLHSTSKNGGYNKLIITRPVQPMGRDIGFLPGSIEEKMAPWVAPIKDNLQFLFGDKTALEMQMEQGTIEIEAMTYIRGRSISNAFIIVDEAQNLTIHELKTIITRVGDNTKIVLTGDIQQIDNVYIDAISNGLTHAVEKFKEQKISGHITLNKGERSTLATLASEIL